MLLAPLVIRLVVAPYEEVHVASDTSVMHLSTFFTMAGRVEEEEYVPVQPEVPGSVRHAFTVVMSLVRVVHVLPSHLATRT